ncbi:hypothetical protein CRENPOLYSF2_2620006 [Crenothrix polyspora]|uniref:Uncharacterized protein n=1 Tax=Crenothrix polyspora TaxID=360316 RepID=A0A1R4H7P6_9GAMM|nr:hypothetical protein CRENPOLYSF2_2620006 [Crenothrix polyspora]
MSLSPVCTFSNATDRLDGKLQADALAISGNPPPRVKSDPHAMFFKKLRFDETISSP